MATADFGGTTFSGLLGTGTRLDAGRWGLEPFGTIRYSRLNEDGFTEEGAGGVNLIAQNRTADWLGSELGLRVTTTFLKERSAWLPEFRLAWDHDFGLSDREATVAFEAAPDAQFTVTGQAVEGDGVTAGLGLSYQTVSGWKASVRYNHTQSGDFQANGFMIRLGSGF